MIISDIINFFGSNIYLFLLVIPLLSQLWILPVGAMLFILFAWTSANNLSQLFLLFLIVLISSIIWDISGYFIGRKVSKFKKLKKQLNRKIIKNIYSWSKKYFNEKWEIAIFLSRFLITWIGAPINYVVGFQAFSFKKFAFYVVFWEILYASELLILGYVFKDTFDEIYTIISNFSLIILLIFIMYEIGRYIFLRKHI